MKTVKLCLYQNLVNYRRELSYGYVQTYPLPTPSMVKGMAHALLGLKQYHDLKISIQGSYKTIATNMQRVVKFDRVRENEKRYKIKAGGSQRTLLSGNVFVDQIVDLDLVIHIDFKDEALNERLLQAAQTSLIVLGRNEDIARLDYEKSKLVSIIEKKDYEGKLNHNIYLNPQFVKNNFLQGTHYRLPFYYKPVVSAADKRIFTYVDCVYITRDSTFEEADFFVDQDGDIVDFMESECVL